MNTIIGPIRQFLDSPYHHHHHHHQFWYNFDRLFTPITFALNFQRNRLWLQRFPYPALMGCVMPQNSWKGCCEAKLQLTDKTRHDLYSMKRNFSRSELHTALNCDFKEAFAVGYSTFVPIRKWCSGSCQKLGISLDAIFLFSLDDNLVGKSTNSSPLSASFVLVKHV